MNLDQMEFRCPDAEVIGNVVVKDYRLVFRGNSRGNGVASILPEQGEQVSGVLWSITEKCEKSLDYYEGYPYLYGKQDILVQCEDGQELYAATRASRHFRANYIWKGFWKDAGRMDYRKMRSKKLSIRPEKK